MAQATTQTQKDKAPTNNAIAALILGILSLITPGLGIIMAIIAIVLGINVLKHKESKGFGIAGIITGSLSILIHIIVIIGIVMFVSKVADDPASAMHMIPGIEGCNTDGPMLCTNYTYGPELALTLMGDQHVSSVTAEVFTETPGTNGCSWQGNETLQLTGTTITLPCNQPLNEQDIMTFIVTWRSENGNLQETNGLIVPA